VPTSGDVIYIMPGYTITINFNMSLSLLPVYIVNQGEMAFSGLTASLSLSLLSGIILASNGSVYETSASLGWPIESALLAWAMFGAAPAAPKTESSFGDSSHYFFQ
jgi:hypothetical protein